MLCPIGTNSLTLVIQLYCATFQPAIYFGHIFAARPPLSTADVEPLLLDIATLEGPARSIASAAGDLGRHLHPATLRAVAELLRTINCYYSNLIEGHDTHPISIERAMREEFSPDRATRNLQLEARAHIEVQRLVESRLAAKPATNVCSTDFLRFLHREFYERLPDELRIVRHPRGDREETVIPGELRRHDVRVGDHVAPPVERLEPLLARFAEVYDPARFAVPSSARDRPGVSPPPGEIEQWHALAVLGAAHHRVLWIHPFGDGNGRVARLMTDAYLQRAGVGGHGLWTVSRGLARTHLQYRQALATADQARLHDLDGRGARSARGLDQFCRYFLDVCADQVAYMGEMLEINGFVGRFMGYCRAREAGLIAGPLAAEVPVRRGPGRPRVRFRPQATALLEAVLLGGPMARGDVAPRTGLSERTARRMVSELLADGLLASASARAPLELRIPAHAARFVLPALYERF